VSFVLQAEDGIRDFHVTGVQTCALPIFPLKESSPVCGSTLTDWILFKTEAASAPALTRSFPTSTILLSISVLYCETSALNSAPRSEERRVGKECRSRWRPFD